MTESVMSVGNETSELTPKPEKVRGPRGEVGNSSPSKRLKELWHETGKGLSLKVFIKGLKGNEDVKTWRDNKLGKNEQKRTDANAQMARTCAAATKLERRKKKVQNKKSEPAESK